jgi:hypothetical protein
MNTDRLRFFFLRRTEQKRKNRMPKSRVQSKPSAQNHVRQWTDAIRDEIAENEHQLFIQKSCIVGAGEGLFTKRAFERGALLAEYTGTYVTKAQLDRRYPGHNIARYALDLADVPFYVDAETDLDCLARYANDLFDNSLPFSRIVTGTHKTIPSSIQTYIRPKGFKTTYNAWQARRERIKKARREGKLNTKDKSETYLGNAVFLPFYETLRNVRLQKQWQVTDEDDPKKVLYYFNPENGAYVAATKEMKEGKIVDMTVQHIVLVANDTIKEKEEVFAMYDRSYWHTKSRALCLSVIQTLQEEKKILTPDLAPNARVPAMSINQLMLKMYPFVFTVYHSTKEEEEDDEEEEEGKKKDKAQGNQKGVSSLTKPKPQRAVRGSQPKETFRRDLSRQAGTTLLDDENEDKKKQNKKGIEINGWRLERLKQVEEKDGYELTRAVAEIVQHFQDRGGGVACNRNNKTTRNDRSGQPVLGFWEDNYYLVETRKKHKPWYKLNPLTPVPAGVSQDEDEESDKDEKDKTKSQKTKKKTVETKLIRETQPPKKKTKVRTKKVSTGHSVIEPATVHIPSTGTASNPYAVPDYGSPVPQVPHFQYPHLPPPEEPVSNYPYLAPGTLPHQYQSHVLPVQDGEVPVLPEFVDDSKDIADFQKFQEAMNATLVSNDNTRDHHSSVNHLNNNTPYGEFTPEYFLNPAHHRGQVKIDDDDDDDINNHLDLMDSPKSMRDLTQHRKKGGHSLKKKPTKKISKTVTRKAK